MSIVDGVFVRRDADGSRSFVELADIDTSNDAAAFAGLPDQLEGLISDDDVEALTERLEPDSSAAILMFEHTWAKPLRDAVVESGGVLEADLRDSRDGLGRTQTGGQAAGWRGAARGPAVRGRGRRDAGAAGSPADPTTHGARAGTGR